ncbi:MULTISPECIES: GNAT family N-acetyltransferase [unclassified Streptomyces]|uniref:GNAT family N-acetyltransferase n=1 Tax=unclassified Streptomyces TaxID=2593676 RepID=UPI0036499185
MSLTVRPAVLDDAPAVCALMNAVDVVEIGRPETDLHTVEADMSHGETDLARDSWLACDDNGPVAYGIVWSESEGEDMGADLYSLPGRDEAAAEVLERMEARAAGKAAAGGAARAVVHLHLNARPALDTALLVRRGWRTVRRYQVMTRPLSPGVDTVPEPPAGLTLRHCRDEADRRIAHALAQETFAEHFDHHERSYEQWLDDMDAARIDWSLVWIASVAGEGDVAVLLSRDDREAMGWIRTIGVRAAARGRGIGGHLLRHAFGTYAARGRDSIGLGVDTENASGALGLYEAHGMTLHYAVDTWEAVLQAVLQADRESTRVS